MAVPEAEIDLLQALSALRRQAPLVAVCVLLGLVLGYAAAGAGTQVFKVRTVVYVAQTNGLAQPAALTAMAHAPAVLAPIAHQTHLPLRTLETSIAAAPLGGTPSAAATGPTTPFFQITLTGRRRQAMLSASRLLALAMLDRTEGYQRAQIASITAQLRDITGELATLKRRSELAARLRTYGDPVVKLTALGIIQDAESLVTRQAIDLRLKLAQLSQAQQSRITSTTASLVSARTRTTSALVGGTIGLILGLLLALATPARRPVLRLRRRS